MARLPPGARLESVDAGSHLLTGLDLEIEPWPMLRLAGYRERGKVRPAIAKTADWAAAETMRLADPWIGYRILPIRRQNDQGIELEGGFHLKSEAFAALLADACYLAVFVTTMGERLDQAVASSNDQQPLHAYFLELGGRIAIEKATRRLAQLLKSAAWRAKCRLSRRLGPGYAWRQGDRWQSWPLEEQHLLFRVLDGLHGPIRLLDSGAMTPKFSRSGIFGFLCEHAKAARAKKASPQAP